MSPNHSKLKLKESEQGVTVERLQESSVDQTSHII